MKYALGNMLNGAGGLNADGLTLDLQFATDKTLAARKGPTPTFTRASTSTYFAPSVINAIFTHSGDAFNVNTSQLTLVNGRFSWQSGDTSLYYNGSRWILTQDSETVATSALAENAWRPDQADWSGTGAIITATSTFGTILAAINEPRFDHDPVTPACKGLLIEESRTNLVFPSATLTTQTRTVTAVAHTLSFYGTGTVVLSGAHVATVTGTGAYPTRTTLTFTPTAGSLIITVTGSVIYGQLEAGAFPTSYIPAVAASVVRSADVCSITGSDFTGFYNQSEGTFLTQSIKTSTNINAFIINASDNSFINGTDLRYATVTTPSAVINVAGAGQTTGFSGTIISGASAKQALTYKLNDCAYSLNGASAITDTSALIPTVNRINFGSAYTGQPLNGHIAAIRYFKKRLSNAKLQTLTT